MLIPFATKPADVASFDASYVQSATLKCMHGKEVALRDVFVAYTHKDGETDDDNAWYAFCAADCYLHCVTKGNG